MQNPLMPMNTENTTPWGENKGQGYRHHFYFNDALKTAGKYYWKGSSGRLGTLITAYSHTLLLLRLWQAMQALGRGYRRTNKRYNSRNKGISSSVGTGVFLRRFSAMKRKSCAAAGRLRRVRRKNGTPARCGLV